MLGVAPGPLVEDVTLARRPLNITVLTVHMKDMIRLGGKGVS